MKMFVKMTLKKLNAQVLIEEKYYPLYAIVDIHGHTVIQTPDYRRATNLLNDLL